MTTKTKREHTPTPWAVASGSPLGGHLEIHSTIGKCLTVGQVHKEDAAFIVRAANSHDALIEAVTAFVNGDMHDKEVLILAKKALALAGEV